MESQAACSIIVGTSVKWIVLCSCLDFLVGASHRLSIKATVTLHRTISGSHDWMRFSQGSTDCQCLLRSPVAPYTEIGLWMVVGHRTIGRSHGRANTNDWRRSMARSIVGNRATCGSSNWLYDLLLRTTTDRATDRGVRWLIADQSWHPATYRNSSRKVVQPVWWHHKSCDCLIRDHLHHVRLVVRSRNTYLRLVRDSNIFQSQLGSRPGMTGGLAPFTPGLRPGYDLAANDLFLESLANRRTNTRLVAEVVGDRQCKISRIKVDDIVQNDQRLCCQSSYDKRPFSLFAQSPLHRLHGCKVPSPHGRGSITNSNRTPFPQRAILKLTLGVVKLNVLNMHTCNKYTALG